MLARLDELGCDDDAVLLAAWFHDAIYDGAVDGGPGDEERSAQWAEQELAGDPALAAEVGRLVRLTAAHRPEPDDPAGQLLCDADLAILAAGPGRYAAYVAGVRAEYAAVPEADFRAGRRAVLEDLLAKEQLFGSEEARERWETSRPGQPQRRDRGTFLTRRPAASSRATSSRLEIGVAPAATITSYHSSGTS